MAAPLADPDASVDRTVADFTRWLDQHAADVEPYRHPPFEPLEAGFVRGRPLQELLWDDGWSRLGWPVEVGGLGGPPALRAAVYDTFAAAGFVLPDVVPTIEIIGPMLVRYAPHLAAGHVASGVRGQQMWCQGFSEPDAGSDLGSLRTRAVPVDGGWRITGQKMWSSNAHFASWSCLLARTGESDSGYRGITMFWVDLSAEGVRVVPTDCETGHQDTSEIFLDDVFVPEDHIVGEVGAGWSVVMYLMQFERGAFAWLRQATLHLEMDRILAAITDGPVDMAGDDLADVVGDAYLALYGLRSQGARTFRTLTSGEDLGPLISVDKLLLGVTEQTLTDAARLMLSARYLLDDGGDLTHWRSQWSYARITTIYGGAAEVQRDLVAERVLGLPRVR